MKFPYDPISSIRFQHKQGKLSREQALEQLAFVLDLPEDDGCVEVSAKLTYTYGPLLRLSDVCGILTSWATVFSTELPDDSDHKRKERLHFAESWATIQLAISKSNLLARLFFTKESIRAAPCPTHKGRWSGCDFTDNNTCPCQTGGNVTGWLSAEPEKFSDREHIARTKVVTKDH